MKQIVCILVIAVAAAACVKNRTDENEQSKALILARYQFAETFTVPVKEGFTTRVEVDGETIYTGNLPLQIDIPRGASVTRGASEVKCFYVPNESEIASGSVQRRGMLLFEDLNSGDNDYNDFVCEMFEHLNVQKVNNKYRVALNGSHFTPLALGNSYTIPIGFGYEIRDSQTGELIDQEILSHNVRDDWFGGGKGFINTVIGEDAYKAKQVNVKDSEFRENLANPIAFNWFIVVDGMKRYSTDSHKYLQAGITYNEVVTHKLVPFGLFLVSKDKDTWRWPIEKCYIGNAYPLFDRWIKGEVDDPFAQRVESLLYK